MNLAATGPATGPTTGPAAPAQPPAAEETPGVALTPTSSPGARSGTNSFKSLKPSNVLINFCKLFLMELAHLCAGAGGGSKTVPSTGAGSSSGSVQCVPLRLLMSAVFVVLALSLLN